jgi:rhamnosyltransferase
MNGSISNKLAGVVILYNPASQKTLENILSYSTGLKKLYILDNSEQKYGEWELLSKQIGGHVEYINYGSNEGISKRLNTAAHKAIEEGYNFLLTMDQDSSFPVGIFDKYLNEIENCSINNVGQFGINFQPQFTAIEAKPVEALSLITSGSIINLAHFLKIGDYNEDLFIDFVDLEFSHRVNNAGYKVVQFTNIILNHQIGDRVPGRSFKTFKVTNRIIHSPIRVYYIVRNGLYLIFKAKNISKNARFEIFRGMTILKNNFIYHPQLFKIYLSTIVGIIDFVGNKMGKK